MEALISLCMNSLKEKQTLIKNLKPYIDPLVSSPHCLAGQLDCVAHIFKTLTKNAKVKIFQNSLQVDFASHTLCMRFYKP